jgi:Arc/MetJ family transcription regulator
MEMRLTVDVADELLDDVCRIMNEQKKSPAVAKALAEFVRRENARNFGQLLRKGEFDYPVSNAEVEKLQG